MKLNEKFSTINDDVGVIAVREKASVEIDEDYKEVKMHDFTYTFDEIIAVADKLQAISTPKKKLTFS